MNILSNGIRTGRRRTFILRLITGHTTGVQRLKFSPVPQGKLSARSFISVISSIA